MNIDGFARAVAAGLDRRRVITLLLASVTETRIFSAFAAADDSAHGRRSEPLAALAASTIACQKSNAITGTCQELSQYVDACGVYDQVTGRHEKGDVGATFYGELRHDPPKGLVTGVEVGRRGDIRCKCFKGRPGEPKPKWCKKGLVRTRWSTPRSDRVALTLTPDPDETCCPDACFAAFDAYNVDTVQHEQFHHENLTNALQTANEKWWELRPGSPATGVAIEACALTQKGLDANFKVEVANQLARESTRITTEIKREPPNPPFPDCDQVCPEECASDWQQVVGGRVVASWFSRSGCGGSNRCSEMSIRWEGKVRCELGSDPRVVGPKGLRCEPVDGTITLKWDVTDSTTGCTKTSTYVGERPAKADEEGPDERPYFVLYHDLTEPGITYRQVWTHLPFECDQVTEVDACGGTAVKECSQITRNNKDFGITLPVDTVHAQGEVPANARAFQITETGDNPQYVEEFFSFTPSFCEG
jgi:hypothetical protein